MNLNQLFAVDPYRMVLVNIISLTALVLLLTLNKFLFPKKKIPYPILLLAFSILPIISIFRQGTYESGDLTINAIKLISFSDSLKEGILIPRWAGELNATYGYPKFIFAYPLPYYIGSILNFLGASYVNSIKLLIITVYFLSGLSVFYWLKYFTKPRDAFLGAILYQFAPYLLIDMHFRVDIGELTALFFLPLSVFAITAAHKKNKFLYDFLASFSISLLILSHQAVSLFSFPLLFFYSFILIKKISVRKVIRIIKMFTLSLSLSAYYWIPILLESKFTKQVLEIQKEVTFPSFRTYLFSPYRWGFLFQGSYGELATIIGYVQIIIIIIAIWLVIKKQVPKDYARVFNYFMISLSIYIFLLTSHSKPIYNLLPIFKNIQFPYRILSVIILIISGLGAIVSNIINLKKINLLIISLAILTTILNWGNRGMVQGYTDDYLRKILPLSTYQREGLYPALPIWVSDDKPWQNEVPDKYIEGIDGEIKVLTESRLSTKHSYIIKIESDTLIKENTLYFPGWKLYIDGKEESIDFENPNYPGIVTFNLNKGTHTVILSFKDTPIRLYSRLISSLSLFASGIVLLLTQNSHRITLRLKR